MYYSYKQVICNLNLGNQYSFTKIAIDFAFSFGTSNISLSLFADFLSAEMKSSEISVSNYGNYSVITIDC